MDSDPQAIHRIEGKLDEIIKFVLLGDLSFNKTLIWNAEIVFSLVLFSNNSEEKTKLLLIKDNNKLNNNIIFIKYIYKFFWKFIFIVYC